MIDHADLVQLREEGTLIEYHPHDCMLYALAVGMGRDPLDRQELPYVMGPTIQVLPSMAATLARRNSIALLSRSGMDATRALFGQQSLHLHGSLPAGGRLLADGRVVAAFDKGPARGAVVHLETILRRQDTGDPVATAAIVAVLRGDGGYGGPSGTIPGPPMLPDRVADHLVLSRTHPNQALLYRLTGDENPIHADPDLAQALGFDRPILHGLCTYGIACHAVLRVACGLDPGCLAELVLKFSAPVLPGDTIQTQLWMESEYVLFGCSAIERNVPVGFGMAKVNRARLAVDRQDAGA